jgi:hypothetical protein
LIVAALHITPEFDATRPIRVADVAEQECAKSHNQLSSTLRVPYGLQMSQNKNVRKVITSFHLLNQVTPPIGHGQGNRKV